MYSTILKHVHCVCQCSERWGSGEEARFKNPAHGTLGKITRYGQNSGPMSFQYIFQTSFDLFTLKKHTRAAVNRGELPCNVYGKLRRPLPELSKLRLFDSTAKCDQTKSWG